MSDITVSTSLHWDGDRVMAKIDGASADGVELACEHLLGLSQAIVPLEEAILQNSGTVDIDRNRREGTVSYDTPYAVVQHERLDYRHDPGRQAKYLEGPLDTDSDTLIALVALPLRGALNR